MINTSKSNELPANAGAGTNLDADTLLQASRRIDWRFLMPDPELGQVACLGILPADLLDSLRLFSDSLTVLTPDVALNTLTEQYDIVVVQQLSLDKLHSAAGLIRPGGYLYAENEGMLSPNGPRPPWKHGRLALPTGCIAAVSQAGFVDVQAHWHWPNFASCTRIIPLDDRGAVQYAFVSGGRSIKARLQSVIGRTLLWSGLLERIVPRFSIIARLDDR